MKPNLMKKIVYYKMLKELFSKIAQQLSLNFVYNYLGEADDALNNLSMGAEVLILNKAISINSELDEFTSEITKETASLEFHLLINGKENFEDLRKKAAQVVQLASLSSLAQGMPGNDKRSIARFRTESGIFTSTNAVTLKLTFDFTYNPQITVCNVSDCEPIKVNYDC